MIGSILLGVGCFAFGGMVGFFGAQAAISYAALHNTNGFRDTLKKNIAKAEDMDRAERAMESMLAAARGMR